MKRCIKPAAQIMKVFCAILNVFRVVAAFMAGRIYNTVILSCYRWLYIGVMGWEICRMQGWASIGVSIRICSPSAGGVVKIWVYMRDVVWSINTTLLGCSESKDCREVLNCVLMSSRLNRCCLLIEIYFGEM